LANNETPTAAGDSAKSTAGQYGISGTTPGGTPSVHGLTKVVLWEAALVK